MYELGYWNDKLQRRVSFRDMVEREVIEHQERKFKDLQDKEWHRLNTAANRVRESSYIKYFSDKEV